MALAHTIASKVERAHRRGDQFDKRRKLMDTWPTIARRKRWARWLNLEKLEVCEFDRVNGSDVGSMREQNPFHEDREELKEILRHYHNLKNGRQHPFIEEDDFERIIDYFDDHDSITEALEAAEIGMEQFPSSGPLMIKKADLLIATRKYHEAIALLDLAAIYDSLDINLYILRTDALLALDRQHEAIEILQEALQIFTGDERIELLFEMADVYDDYEEFDKVFDCLKLVLEDEPNNEEALYKICFWTDFTGRNEESIKLHQKTERREERTTEGGLNVAGLHNQIAPIVSALNKAGARVSLFIEPDPVQIAVAEVLGAPVVELHTGRYAELWLEGGAGAAAPELERLKFAAADARRRGIEPHAGHGLTFENVGPVAAIPELAELNIGHFLIGEAIFIGLEASIREMRRRMDIARGAAAAA